MDESRPSQLRQRGMLVILVILLLGIGLSTFAWWYRKNAGVRSLEMWGPKHANLIRHTPIVHLLHLQALSEDGTASSDAPPPTETIMVENHTLQVVQQESLIGKPGFVHARHALIEDASFVWDAAPNACEGKWTFALRFSDDEKAVTVVFNPECKKIYCVEGEFSATMQDVIQAFDEKFGPRS